jgi:hypothetical protein
MIECIFTIDYEIYGNGAGSLRELVVEPTDQLRRLFKGHSKTFVVFAEVAEFERIEEFAADEAIGDVRTQLRQLHNEGFEIGLHLHPQWYNGRREDGKWVLDQTEYSLCHLPEERIDAMLSRAINYLRSVLGDPHFVPVSFRAGNWLLQPTATVAKMLYRHGIRLDSSVFKGGLQRMHGMDYRPALKNGQHWRFSEDVNVQDPSGCLLEVPIHTEMLPFWKMIKPKRLRIQSRNAKVQDASREAKHYRNFARFRYPRKLDFCRMTSAEMRSCIDRALNGDLQSPNSYKPLVSIGHSKDLIDIKPIDQFLRFLAERSINISDLKSVFAHLG